jgi:hypothetical protein
LPPRPFGVGEFDFDNDEGIADFEDSVGDGHADAGTILVEYGWSRSEVDPVDGGEHVDDALLIGEAKALCRRMAAISSGCAAESDISRGSLYSFE